MVEKIEKELVETKQGILVPVLVIPKGKEFAVVGFDEWGKTLKIRVKEAPKKGKANQELVEKLEKFFKAKVEIVSGEKQRKKKLLVHAEKEKVLESLSSP